MGKAVEVKSRSIVEQLTDLNPSPCSPIRSVALSTTPSIYAGTDAGTLLLLSLTPSLSLQRYTLVSQSPITTIHVIRPQETQILLLSGGALYVIDSALVTPARKVGGPLFRGEVSALAARVVSPGFVHPFASAHGSHLSSGLTFLQKFGGGGGIKSNGFKAKETMLQREGTSLFAIVVGRKLMLVDIVFGESCSFLVLKEIQCGEGVMTIVWLDDSIILGNSTGYFLYSYATGLGGLIFSLPDPLIPPRLKLLQKEYKVLLLVDNVGVTVNAQGQPVGGSLVFRHAPDAVGEIASCVVVVRSGTLELYHKRSGNCLQVVSFAEEGVGHCILADQSANEKLIVVATRSKIFCYKKVSSEDQIKDLLRKKNFVEAISLVEELQMEGEMTREMLSFVHAQAGFLLLFDLHFEEAVNHFLLSEDMQPSEVFPFIMRDPNRWSLLVPRNRYWGLHPPPAPLENVVDDGLMSIQRAIFLRKVGVETVVEDIFLLNPPNRAELLESAIKNIIRYLCVSREKDLNLLVKEGVDTLLIYLYRALNRVEDMERLASSENNCVVEELQTLLTDSGHLRTLAFLYASKGMSSEALSIWRALARNYSSGLWKEPTMEVDLQHIPTNLSSGKEIAAMEASQILEKSSNQDLVLRHLGWLADIDQALAIRVLTSERADQLSPDKVIAAIDPKKVDILQRYLQWLIEDQDSEDIQFHTTYALLLAKSAFDSFETENANQGSAAGFAKKLNTFAKGKDRISGNSVRERLQIFLQSSELYDPEEVLDLIEGSELWLEKAILYKRLGQETLVLQILALKLEDSEAAEFYCAEIGRPDAYMQLLEMYLDPKDGKEPMFTAAVRLLHNHGESLDPLKVLERLSPDMPLQLASDTILRMLRARVHHHRQGQIEHNLSRALHVDASVAGLEERSRNVQINDECLCDSCHAHLGTKLFAMYPDDTIVCYKCFRRLGEFKSVNGRDFKQDPMFKAGWLVAP